MATVTSSGSLGANHPGRPDVADPPGAHRHRPWRVDQLETPALTIDLLAVERNIARMQEYCARHNLDLRPHVKTHKLPQIAHLQLNRGAVGIACQKGSEAEAMADAGVGSMLVTFPLVGEAKWARAAKLADRVDLSVAGDSTIVAAGLSAALRPGTQVGFLVECDVGSWRTGVQQPDDALRLAEELDAMPGLVFAGLMTHPAPRETEAWFTAARQLFRDHGRDIPRFSVGGTPTAFGTHERVAIATELRAGTYVYGDRACLNAGVHRVEDCALRVRTTVASRPTPTRAILDAGSKTLTSDPAEGLDDGLFGMIVEFPDARIVSLSEEHGHVELSRPSERPAIGEAVTVIPNHACGTTNLHDYAHLHRKGVVCDRARIAARGAVL